MKRLTHHNAHKQLQKNRTLVKSTKDSTVVYVFSGHPYDSYMGREDVDTLLLYSLTTNGYRRIGIGDLNGDEKFFIVESEEDVVGTLEEDEKKTYRKFLDRIDKVFGK
jgi:hypothetical protein